MNKVFLIGRLAADPELRTTQSGISVATFRLAVNRRRANQDGTRTADFIGIVVWRALGENCAKYLSKGSQCAVVGSIQTRAYNAQDGSKRYITEVVADDVEFLARAKDGAVQTASPSYTDSDGFTQVDDGELPF